VRFDLPTIDDDTRPYWDAARDGRLLLRRCNACGAHHHYPRTFCPECWSDEVAWVEASGRATLYTHSTVFLNDLPPFHEQVPYVAAVVELAEGPRMMTKVVDCEPDQLEVGMALEVTFVAIGREDTGSGDDGADEVVLACFRPASAPATGAG
jgi:uncharacterized protein